VCALQHPKIARKLGESDDRLLAVVAWRDAPFFTDAERAALALTEAATRLSDTADPVPDEIWDEAARHYDEQELAGLVMAIASINVWNRLNVATRQVAGAEW
jgi:alkylhydroperoxidase family enzyme